MRLRPRGFLMILVLLLSVLLVTMGLGFLGSKAGQYQSTASSVQASQARALARAGMEDARTKLNRDLTFPPAGGPGQKVFTYIEVMQDSNGKNVGLYRVQLDSTYAAAPYNVVSVTSRGMLGSASAPTACHTYRAFVDVSTSSPTYFQIIRWSDQGSI